VKEYMNNLYAGAVENNVDK